MEEIKDGVATYYAESPEAWRKWLEINQDTERSVWLILYKKGHPMAGLTYDLAVNEALCFGWIDSKPNKRDNDSFYQFFARRNPKSNWSRVNKDKVAMLFRQGKMTESGLRAVEMARQNGCWDALDKVDKLELPEEMIGRLKANPVAGTHWEAFPKSVKRGILEWIYNAKTESTRSKRILQTVELAAENKRALQYQPGKKE